MQKRNFTHWNIQVPGWLLLAYLMYAQAVSFADLVFYIPLLAAALIGLMKQTPWARVVAAAAFGITVYWPIVCLATVVDARGAPGWSLRDETAYWIVLPLIAIWGLWGLWRLLIDPVLRR